MTNVSSEDGAAAFPFVGDKNCASLSPMLGGQFYPNGSDQLSNQLEPNQSLCVRVAKGAVSISFSPDGIKSEATMESRAAAVTESPSCSVRAMILYCKAITLKTGTYRIATATGDALQTRLIFIGGYFRPGPDGRLTTHPSTSGVSSELRVFQKKGPCRSNAANTPERAMLIERSLFNGQGETFNDEISGHASICATIIGTITFEAL